MDAPSSNQQKTSSGLNYLLMGGLAVGAAAVGLAGFVLGHSRGSEEIGARDVRIGQLEADNGLLLSASNSYAVAIQLKDKSLDDLKETVMGQMKTIEFQGRTIEGLTNSLAGKDRAAGWLEAENKWLNAEFKSAYAELENLRPAPKGEDKPVASVAPAADQINYEFVKLSDCVAITRDYLDTSFLYPDSAFDLHDEFVLNLRDITPWANLSGPERIHRVNLPSYIFSFEDSPVPLALEADGMVQLKFQYPLPNVQIGSIYRASMSALIYNMGTTQETLECEPVYVVRTPDTNRVTSLTALMKTYENFSPLTHIVKDRTMTFEFSAPGVTNVGASMGLFDLHGGAAKRDHYLKSTSATYLGDGNVRTTFNLPKGVTEGNLYAFSVMASGNHIPDEREASITPQRFLKKRVPGEPWSQIVEGKLVSR